MEMVRRVPTYFSWEDLVSWILNLGGSAAANSSF